MEKCTGKVPVLATAEWLSARIDIELGGPIVCLGISRLPLLLAEIHLTGDALKNEPGKDL